MKSGRTTQRNRFEINFYCRASKADRNGNSPIELSLVLNGDRTYVNLNRRMKSKDFNTLVKLSKRNNEVKDYLELQRQRVYDIQKQLLENNMDVNLSSIKSIFLGSSCEMKLHHTIFGLLNEYLDILSKGMGVTVQYENYRKYRIVRDRFMKYRNNVDLELSKMNPTIISGFIDYLLIDEKLEANTTYGIMSKLKCVCKYGFESGYMSKNPFATIKLHKKEKTVEFLTEKEIMRIYNKDLSDLPRLEQIRDCFIFACHTGLAFTDMAQLTTDDIQHDENTNLYYIKKERQKTKIVYTIPLLEIPLSILHKYSYKLPVISNQKYNAYLKEIADICGITKPLHSHIARHSAACLMLNTKKLNLTTIQKVLGHSNIKMTQKYAKLMDSTVLTEFANLK